MPIIPASAPAQDDFFLPEFCSGGVLLVVVLIAELTALMLTITKHLPDEGTPLWLDLARMSLFLQWIALSASGVLCLARRYLTHLTLRWAALVSYALLLAVTLALSELAYILSSYSGIGRELLPASHGDFVLRNMLIGAIVSALVLRYFYVIQQWKNNIQREARSRFEVLQARIRPHFLFNSMNTIAALIRSKPELAERAVEDLADLFRASLADAGASVPLSEELALAQQYARIETLRLGERLKLEWELDGVPRDTQLPHLTLQPLIENAIYHGIEPRADGGTVKVHGVCIDGVVTLEIRNPLPPDDTPARRGRHMALDNVRERLALAWPGRATLTATRLAEEFHVRLNFPYQGGTP
jgi:two-component system sensor histidine kinase AlgZ